jgi:hypothetical protein
MRTSSGSARAPTALPGPATTPAAIAAATNPLSAGHVSSAIPDLSVADIRRALALLRDQWTSSTPDAPMFICDKLFRDMTIQEFTSRFVLGQHLKRHAKSNLQRSAGALLTDPSATGASCADTPSRAPVAVPPPDNDPGGGVFIPALSAMTALNEEGALGGYGLEGGGNGASSTAAAAAAGGPGSAALLGMPPIDLDPVAGVVTIRPTNRNAAPTHYVLTRVTDP